jgi:hypothetical protein
MKFLQIKIQVYIKKKNKKQLLKSIKLHLALVDCFLKLIFLYQDIQQEINV